MQRPGSSSIVPTVYLYSPSAYIFQDFIRDQIYRVQRSQDWRSQRHWLAILLDYRAGASGHLKILRVHNKNVLPSLFPFLKLDGVLCSNLECCSAVYCVSRELFRINPKNYAGTISVKVSKYMLFTLKKIKIAVYNWHKSSHLENNVCLP